MPVCDGATCNKQVPWRATESALQLSTGNVKFSTKTAFEKLNSVLKSSKCWNIKPSEKKVIFKNLCKDCWPKQAARWGDVSTYEAARARTVPEAIYFQVESKDFHINNQLDKQAIISCVVHELMHYWSHSGSGLQAFNRIANVDWDEAVTDVLGYRVYKEMYHGEAGFANYVTPYNTYCMCMTKAKVAFSNIYGRLKSNPESRSRLPPPVCEEIEAQTKANKPIQLAKEAASEVLAKCLTEYLFTWYFKGPKFPISPDIKKSPIMIEKFLTNDNLGNMFPVAKVFEGYAGNNTLHPI